jgi:hypothetical protein
VSPNAELSREGGTEKHNLPLLYIDSFLHSGGCTHTANISLLATVLLFGYTLLVLQSTA